MPYHHGFLPIYIGTLASISCNSVNIAMQDSHSYVRLYILCNISVGVQVLHIVTVQTVGDNTMAPSVG